MIHKKNIKPLLIFIVSAFLIDQISKLLIVNTLTPFEPPRQIISTLLRFKLIYNPSGVFGISFGPDILYYILSVIGIFVLFYISLMHHDKIGIIILGFIIGGALGNFVDRIRLNYVIDFVDMGIGNLRWFTYNFADAFITVGAVFLLGREVITKKEKA